MAKHYVELGTLIIALFILYLLITFLHDPIKIVINSLIGIGALFVLNSFLKKKIPINILSIGIIAIGGIVGFVLVVVLHFLKIAF
jgi:hypothetical protein